MADYTILSNSVKQNRSEVVIEFTVPGGSNTAGVGWQTVVAELRAQEQASPDAAVTVNPRKLTDGPYVASLDAGQIVELALTVEYDANLTNGQKVAVLDVAVADKVTKFTNDFGNLYEFYGTVRGDS
jgi:hypothetical protein